MLVLVAHGDGGGGGGLEVGLHQEYRRPEQRPGHARQRAAGGTPEWFSSKLHAVCSDVLFILQCTARHQLHY